MYTYNLKLIFIKTCIITFLVLRESNKEKTIKYILIITSENNFIILLYFYKTITKLSFNAYLIHLIRRFL